LQILLSLHAQEQMRKRNFSLEDVRFIVENKWKDKKHNTGKIFYQFRKDDLPKHLAHVKKYQRLVGTTVLACGKCGLYIITMYKNPKAFKADMKKRKYDKNKKKNCCPCCNGNNR